MQGLTKSFQIQLIFAST